MYNNVTVYTDVIIVK